MTRLWAGQSGVRIPVKARDFSLLKYVQTGLEARPGPYSTGTVVLSGG
jgi:hypothetical protein